MDFLNITITNDINTNKVINSGGKKWDSMFMKNLLMGEGGIKKILRIFLSKRVRVNIKKKTNK